MVFFNVGVNADRRVLSVCMVLLCCRAWYAWQEIRSRCSPKSCPNSLRRGVRLSNLTGGHRNLCNMVSARGWGRSCGILGSEVGMGGVEVAGEARVGLE